MGKPRKAERRPSTLDYATPPPPRRSALSYLLSRPDRRLWVILIGSVLLLLGVYGFTGDTHFLPVTLGLLNDGLFLTGWAASAGMLGAVLMRLLCGRLGSSPSPGTPGESRGEGLAQFAIPALSLRLLTSIALGIGLISVLLLALGLAGLVNLFSAISVLLIGPILWAIAIRLEPGGVDRVRASLAAARAWLLEPAGWGWLWLLALPSLVVACCGASIMPGVLWNPLDPHPYDVAAYHLQVPREWYESGRISQLRHNVYSHFPFNVEMHFLLAMLLRGGPWKGMYTAQFISLASSILTVLAVYAAATDWSRGGAPDRPRFQAAGTIAGVFTASIPWVPMLGSLAYVEGMLLLYFTLSLAWLLRALREPHSRQVIRAMLFAGLLAGLACGVKYTAAPTILIFFPVVLFIIVLSRRLLPSSPSPGTPGESRGERSAQFAIPSLRSTLLGCVLFTAAGTAAFSPWLIRNFAWTGNPVFPLAMRTLGSAHFDDTQVERWNRAHRASPQDAPWSNRFKLLATRVFADWMYAYVLLPAGLIALILLAFRGARGPRGPEVAALALLVLLQTAFWLAFTHLMPRFAVFLVPLCALAAGVGFSGRLAPAGAALALASVALGFMGLPLSESSPGLRATFWQFSLKARVGFYRLEDTSALNPTELEGIEDRRNIPVALIGDAQAFHHQLPMTRLRYRVIFDIRFPPGVSALDAWLEQSEELLRRDHIVIVHPSEIRRLSRTYHAVPGLPDRLVPRGYVTPNNDYQPVGDVPWSQTSDWPHIWPQGGVTGAR